MAKTKLFKKKPIYTVWLQTKYGIGAQPVKADNAKEARKKFRKRYPKRRIISVNKSSEKNHIIDPI